MVRRLTCCLVAFLLFSASAALAGIPREILFQGFLTDAQNNVVANASHSVTVSFWDGPDTTSAQKIWEETHTDVTVTDGVYSLLLGSKTPFSDPDGNQNTADFLTFSSPYYLGIQVDDDAIMTHFGALPPLGSVAYALRAQTASGRIVRAINQDIAITPKSELDVLLASGNVTITLPAAADARGRLLTIKKVDENNATVSIVTPNGSGATVEGINRDTAAGGTPLFLSRRFQTIILTSDGTNWFRLADAGTVAITDTDIADNAITTSKIQNGSVTIHKISKGIAGVGLAGGGGAALAVQTDGSSIEISEGAVSIKNGGVSEGKLAADAVTEKKIKDGAVTASKIGASAVTATNIATGAVTETKIKDNAVTTSKLAATAVTEAKLAADAVTETKIKNGAVTASKIGASAVTATNIATDAVTETKIKDNAVTTSKLAATAVTEAKLAADAVTETKIKEGAVTASKISVNAVTSTKLANDAITTAKLADDSVTEKKLDLRDILIFEGVEADNNKKIVLYANEAESGSVVLNLPKTSGTLATTQNIREIAIQKNASAGGDLSGIYPNPTIANNAVNAAKISDGSVGSDEIAKDAVTANHIKSGQIQSGHLADGSVSNSKLDITTSLTFKANGPADFASTINKGTPTANRSITLPDASGTLVLAGSDGAVMAQNVIIPTSAQDGLGNVYLGAQGDADRWRIRLVGGNLSFQYWENASSSWVSKFTILH